MQQSICYPVANFTINLTDFFNPLWRPRMSSDELSEHYQSFVQPVVKANKLSAANLEALVNFQMNALQSYIDLAMDRMKAAADISDPDSLQSFLTSQSAAIGSLQQKFMDDSKALSALTSQFKSEFDKLVEESLPLTKK